ncbi:PHP domain-containing protein [Terrabacter sp. Soil810]|uniref:PHP domain-containing protein n=1 Tax=Terrabacter sp. Soil810 TaxID=1736418 RepID=UPI00070DDF30|nr:PHP domain-containing protein [Terrabacter sp. Soil810]KRF40477.1 metal-dependent phosphoesterase [Terrabacter sp. Soil810]
MTPTGTAGAARTRPVIDLHTHSAVSDGTETPSELVAAAAAAGVDVLAVTDHDTVAGWDEAAEAARDQGVTLVRGIEISCAWRHSSIHLLGYLPDADDRPLMEELARARDSRSTRLERMVALMAADGIPLGYDEVLAQVGPDATPGRPHIADALIANGTIRHRDEAFRSWLGDDSPYYVGHYAPDPVRAVELVRAAGGVPVIAHPFTRTRSGDLDDALVERMRDAGLAGLEARHRDHGPAEVARATALADRLGLLVTGSSDYHGEGKRNRLAENTTTPEVLDAIEAASSGATEVLRP